MEPYRRQKRRLAVFVGSLLLASALTLGRSETYLFPLFSWALFTRVPGEVVDVTVVYEEGPSFASLLAGLRSERAASLYALLQRSSPQPSGPLDRQLLALNPAPYRLVRRRFDPLKIWDGTDPPLGEARP